MKRIIGLFALTVALALPGVSFAAEQIGVYVAPKFIYGYTQMDGFKHRDDSSFSLGDKDDNAFGGALAIGYDFDKQFGVPIRAEIEYSIFSKVEAKKSWSDPHDRDWAGTDKQDFNIHTLFLNAYWDINTGTAFTPYLGAGLGMAFIDTKFRHSGYDLLDPTDTRSESSGSKTRTNFAWNVGAGLGYDITESWTVDLGYRFVSLGSVKSGSFDNGTSVKTDNLYQHQVALGLRYTF